MNQYVMQARSSTSGAMVMWLAATADWAAAGFPGPGTAQDIAVSSVPVSGGTPGGTDGQVQIKSGPAFAGTPKIAIVAGEANFSGVPIHNESEAWFSGAGSAYGHARAKWIGATTPSDTDVVLQTINVPTAFGDCHVTVTWEATVSAASGGGNLIRKAVYKRLSGAWSPVNDNDRGDPADIEVSVFLRAGAPDGQNLTLIANGINATNVNWVISTHVQVTAKAT